MPKQRVTLEVVIVIDTEAPNIDLDEVIDALDYEFVSMTEDVEVVDTEILDYYLEK